MQSIQLLAELEQVPLRGGHGRYTYEDVVELSGLMRNDLFAIEVAAGVEDSCSALFDARNVPDDLFEAYRLASPDVAADYSLHERYLEMRDRGPESVEGFISNLKGKLGELRVKEHLEQEYPDWSFSMARDQNQPVWDIVGTSSDGTVVVPIQVKIGDEQYAPEVAARMQEDPDVLFAVSNEIRTKLAEHPELSSQFIDTNLSNYEFVSEVEEGMGLLTENSGIDVPDKVSGFLPYVTEIVLGIRLLYDIVKTERDFEAVEIEDKTRINAMKALVLFQRFGISAVLTTAGGAAGSIVPGFGNILGAITGAGLSIYLSSKLRPHMLEIGMKLAGITADDLFYFRNKVAIDRIGDSLAHTAASMP